MPIPEHSIIFLLPMLLPSITTVTFLSLLLNSSIPYPETLPLSETEPRTIIQVAQQNPQIITIPPAVHTVILERDSYSATTPEEIEQQKQAKAAAEAAAAQQNQSRAANQPVTAPVFNGTVCWPVTNFTYSWDINGFRTSTRPNHNGFDMLAPALTPIYAAITGTVRISQDGYYNYGAAVVIDSILDGQQVSTLYAHMTYGTRTVQPGQQIQAGQLIGLVGMTGSATANHLHFEVKINGTLIDPYSWLEANT